MKMVTIVTLLDLLSPFVMMDMVSSLVLVLNVKKTTVLIVLVMPPSVVNVPEVSVYLLMVNVTHVLLVVPLVSLNVCPDVPCVMLPVLPPLTVVLIVMVKIVLIISPMILKLVNGLLFLNLLVKVVQTFKVQVVIMIIKAQLLLTNQKKL